jgi:hypothetical protein
MKRDEVLVARRLNLHRETAGTAIEENGFECPAEPGRYLVVESNSGDRVWAYSCATLKAAAAQIDESGTERDGVLILDLDKLNTEKSNEAQLTPILTVSSIIGGDEDWNATPEPPTGFRTLSDRELATVLHALRVQQFGCSESECDHFDEENGVTPLDSEKIGDLCEAMNLNGIAILAGS